MAKKNFNWNGTDIGTRAEYVDYDNASSGMSATNVQDAIDELHENGGGGGASYPLGNKKFAVIGDSFSAGGGWITKMCTLLMAGTRTNKAVSGGGWSGSSSASAYGQAQDLADDGVTPDYILCVLGTNDVNNSVQLGTLVNTETIANLDLTTVTGGAQATLITLKNAFPNAIIKIGYTPAGYIHDAFSSISSSDALCQRLKEIANYYGVGYIETRPCGICPYMAADAAAYVSGGHPTGAGQNRIGEYMARIMLNNL